MSVVGHSPKNHSYLHLLVRCIDDCQSVCFNTIQEQLKSISCAQTVYNNMCKDITKVTIAVWTVSSNVCFHSP